MAVRVRLFAALREAAGVGEVAVDPALLPTLLDGLRDRFGDLFTRRLSQASVLVDGRRLQQDAAVEVPDGAEVALLPPFSGGSSDEPPVPAPGLVRPAAAAEPPPPLPVVVAVVALLALLIGPVAVGVVAIVLSAGATVDLAALLGRGGSRPLLPAAAVAVLGAPLTVLLSDGSWEATAALVAGAALLAFALVIVGRIREGVTEVLSATAVVVALGGIGGAGLAALPWVPAGFRFTLAVLVLVATAQVALGTLHFLVRRPGLVWELLAPAVALAVAGLILTVTLDPELSPLVVARLALVALAAAVCARRLRESLADTLLRATRAASTSRGRLTEATCALLLAAPVAYLLVRSAGSTL